MYKRGWLVLILVLPFAFAEELLFTTELSGNLSIEDELLLANETLLTLKELNFSTQRYSDNLFLAYQFYDMQIRANSSDFSAVEQKLTELQELEELAYITRDELRVLEITVESLELQNMTRIYDALEITKTSFRAERYEEALDNIDRTYQIISEVEASETRIRALYDATTRNLGHFLKNNWVEILVILVVFFFLSLLLYAPCKSIRIKRKLHKLQVREHAIQGLIAKTQKEYFDKGTISESSYGIRMKKYRELVRDIHRQMPLLNEEFALTQKFMFNIIKLKTGDIYENKKSEESNTKKSETNIKKNRAQKKNSKNKN